MFEGYISFRNGHRYSIDDLNKWKEASKAFYPNLKSSFSQTMPIISIGGRKVDRIAYIQKVIINNPYVLDCLSPEEIQTLWNHIMNRNLDESIIARSIDILIKCKAYFLDSDRYPSAEIVNNIPWERIRLYAASDRSRLSNLMKIYYSFISIYSTPTDSDMLFKHGPDYFYRDYLVVVKNNFHHTIPEVERNDDGSFNDEKDDRDLAGDFIAELRSAVSKDEQMTEHIKKTWLPDLFGKTIVERVCELIDLSKKAFVKETYETIKKDNGERDVVKYKVIKPSIKGIVIGPNGTGKSTLINEFLGYHLKKKMSESDNRYGYIYPNHAEAVIKRKLRTEEKIFFKEHGVEESRTEQNVDIDVMLTDTGGFMDSIVGDNSITVENNNGELEKISNNELFAFIVNTLAMANSQYDPYSFILYCVRADSKFNNESCMLNIRRIQNTFPDVPIILLLTRSNNDSYHADSPSRLAIETFLDSKVAFNDRRIDQNAVVENNVVLNMGDIIYKARSINSRSIMAGETIVRQHGMSRLGKMIVNAFELFHRRYLFPEYDQIEIMRKWMRKIFSIAYEGIIKNNYFSIIVYGFTAMARELIKDYHNKPNHDPTIAKIYAYLEGIILSAGYGCNMTLIEMMCSHMGINDRGLYITNRQMSKIVKKLKDEDSKFHINLSQLLSAVNIDQFSKDVTDKARMRDLHIDEMTNGFALAFIAEYLGHCIIDTTNNMEIYVREDDDGINLAIRMNDPDNKLVRDELLRIFNEKMGQAANEFINQRLKQNVQNDPVPYPIQKNLLECNLGIPHVFKAYRTLISRANSKN